MNVGDSERCDLKCANRSWNLGFTSLLRLYQAVKALMESSIKLLQFALFRSRFSLYHES